MKKTHHKNEEDQRIFSERLTRVLNAINELSKIGSFDKLCRRSMELAIERLGFDRIDLCFLSEDHQTVLGVYGTDETGHLRNEKHLKRAVKNTPTVKKILETTEPILFFEKEILYNDKLDEVGIGNHAVARLWNGEEILGILAVDNLIHQNPALIENFKICQERINSMALVHEMLYRSQDLSKIDFKRYIENLVNILFRSFGVNTNQIKLELDLESIQLDVDRAVSCGLIVQELVSNALKYAFPKDRDIKAKIHIALQRVNGEIELLVADNGKGIPRITNINDLESLGLKLVHLLGENQLNGKIQIKEENGTQISLRFKDKKKVQ